MQVATETKAGSLQRESRRPLTENDMVRMQIPPRFWEVEVDLIPPLSTMRKTVCKYIDNVCEMASQGVGLLLHGDNGRGKTAAACLCLMEARRCGYTALFFESAKLKSVVINQVAFDDDQTLWDRVQTVDFLVLDDLWKGTTDSKGFGEDLLDELLRTRSANMRPTIITTNMGPVQALQSGAVKKSTFQSMRETTALVEVLGPNMREHAENGIADFFKT